MDGSSRTADAIGRRRILGVLATAGVALVLPSPVLAARRGPQPSDIARLETILNDISATILQLYAAIRENETGGWNDADLIALRPKLMDFGLRLGQLYTGRYTAIATIDDYIRLRNKVLADGQLRVLEQLDLQDAWTAITTTLSALLGDMIGFFAEIERQRPGLLASPAFATLRKAAQRKGPLIPTGAAPVDGKRFTQLVSMLNAYHELRFNVAGTIRLAAGYRAAQTGR